MRLWVTYAGVPLLAAHDRHCVLHHPARAPAYSPASASERSRTATPHEIGLKLFEDYLLPFEVTSVLILIAIVGAIVLARKEID